MKKSIYYISLILIALIGSPICFYCFNLLASDISNYTYGIHDALMVASFPGLIFSFYFILGALYVFRLNKRPEYKKKMTLHYLFIASIFAAVGVITSILTGTICYHSMLAPYPFTCYPLIGLIVHTLILAASIILMLQIKKKLPEDEKNLKTNGKYRIYTAILSMIIFYAFDRAGAAILSPIYIHSATAYKTFPFYLSLLMPLVLLILIVLMENGTFNKKKRLGSSLVSIATTISVVLCVYVLIIGYHDTLFISVISPALPLERLISMPIETIFYLIMIWCIGVYTIIVSFKADKVADYYRI